MRGKSGASAATSGTGAGWAFTRRCFSWNPARAITPKHGGARSWPAGNAAATCAEMPELFAKAKRVKARLRMKKEEVGNRV